jgi:flagellar biosynthesis protein FlhG
LARHGRRTLLVEGNLRMTNLHLLFDRAGVARGKEKRQPPLPTLSKLIDGHASVRDYLFSPMKNLAVLTPAAMTLEESGYAEMYFQRVLSFARSTSRPAGIQFLIFDTASGMPRESQRLMTEVDGIIVLSTPELASIADAYALVKLLHCAGARAEIGLLPSMVSSSREAHELQHKFDLLVEKFLKRRVQRWGHLPFEAKLPAAAGEGKLLWDAAARSPYLLAIADLANTLSAHFAESAGARLHVAG